MYSPTSPRHSGVPPDVDFGTIRYYPAAENDAFENARGVLRRIYYNAPDLLVVDGCVVLIAPDAPATVSRESVRARLCKINATLAPRLSVVDNALLFRYAADD